MRNIQSIVLASIFHAHIVETNNAYATLLLLPMKAEKFHYGDDCGM